MNTLAGVLELPNQAVEVFTTDAEDPYRALITGYQAATTDEDARATADLIFQHCLPTMQGVAINILRDQNTAADVVQDAALKIWKGLGKFESRTTGSFESWVAIITRNCAYDTIRRRDRHPTAPSSSLFDENDTGTKHSDLQYLMQTSEYNPEEVTMANLSATELLAAIPNEDRRRAVALSHVAGLRYNEIAASEEICIGTVRSRISRGLQALRDNEAAEVEHDI